MQSRTILRATALAFVLSFVQSFVPLLTHPLHADEALFAYPYTTETVPRGHWEVEQWTTLRSGKAEGTYRALDLRTEVETGLTDKLQAALYLNSVAHRIDAVPGYDERRGLQLRGVSAELLYRWKSPYLDGYGLAFYVEPGYSWVSGGSGEREKEFELETKLLFQKNFLDDSLVWVVNYVLEPEWAVGRHDEESESHEEGEEAEEEEARRELGEELSTGLSVRVAPRWRLGTELRAHSVWSDFSHREGTALYLGPNIHYGGPRWWWTLAVLPQIWGSGGGGVPGLDLAEHQRLEVRFRVGVNF